MIPIAQAVRRTGVWRRGERSVASSARLVRATGRLFIEECQFADAGGWRLSAGCASAVRQASLVRFQAGGSEIRIACRPPEWGLESRCEGTLFHVRAGQPVFTTPDHSRIGQCLSERIINNSRRRTRSSDRVAARQDVFHSACGCTPRAECDARCAQPNWMSHVAPVLGAFVSSWSPPRHQATKYTFPADRPDRADRKERRQGSGRLCSHRFLLVQRHQRPSV